MLSAEKQSRDLGRGDAGIRGEKADAGHEPRGHGAFAFGGEEPGVGADEILLLIGKTPGGACDRMIAVAALKDISGKAVAELGLKNIEKTVDREDRVVRLIAGVDCGDLFVTDENKGFGTEMPEEGVENLGKLVFRELVQPGTADLGTVEKTLVRGLAHGIKLLVKADRKTEIVEAVLDGFLTDAGGELFQSGVTGGIAVQRLHMELVDRAMGPGAAVVDLLLIAEELGKAWESGKICVLTILHGVCSFLYWRHCRGFNNKSRQS